MSVTLKNLGKVIATVLAWLACSPFAANAQTALVEFSKPLERKIAGFDKAFCVESDAVGRVCKGLVSGDDSPEDARFTVEFGGKTGASWRGAAFLGDVSQFEVWSGDLDGDQENEIIVVNRDGQGNGMGVTYKSVYILPSPAGKKTVQSEIVPLRFSAEDFSAADGFVKNAKTGKFEILVSNWEWNWQTKNKKEGLYLIGRSYIYKNGELLPSAKPIIVRRFTKEFERQRTADLESEKIPFEWLKPADSEKRKSDLMNAAEAETRLSGIIETTESSANLTLQIKTNDGKKQTLEYSSERGDSQTPRFFRFGDWQTRRVFPKNYLPANGLNGKQFRLVHYKDKTESGFNILWLLENK